MQEILSKYDITPEIISKLHEKIFVFYESNKRKLPWRDCFDRYKVRVSETMLQQTQVKRVVDYFHRWMNELPDVFTLASCEKLKLLQLWSGLGFNSRVLRLQQCARVIVEDFGGDMANCILRSEIEHINKRVSDSNSTICQVGNFFKISNIPKNYSDLMKLPGIGPYTAGAIMNFAFNTPAPMVDTNIRRILIAELGLPETISPKELNEISLLVTPPYRANDRGNALMDYGALYFTAQKSGIKPISKQSKFEGSQRQVRGWVMKELSSGKEIFLETLSGQFPRDDLQEIIAKMMQEGLIHFDGKKLALEA